MHSASSGTLVGNPHTHSELEGEFLPTTAYPLSASGASVGRNAMLFTSVQRAAVSVSSDTRILETRTPGHKTCMVFARPSRK
jgi:hypothetical protein